MLIDPPIEVESSCCESLVGLLTRASWSRSCLPRVSTPVACFAPALRAYSGVGHAGFAPASQVNQTSKVIAQGRGRSQAKLLPNFCLKTRQNLEKNPKVAVTVIDLANAKGYQLKGTAELISSGPLFEQFGREAPGVEPGICRAYF